MRIDLITLTSMAELLGYYQQLMPATHTDVVRWRFKDTGSGSFLVGVARDGDELLGMTPFIAESARCDGKLVPVFHAIDTVVSPAARGRGVFAKLGQATCEAAGLKGAKFVYGFPNAAAAKGWFKYNQWTEMGHVPFMVAPLRSGLFIERLVKRRLLDVNLPQRSSKLKDVERVTTFDQRFDVLWTEFSQKIGCCVNRSSAYLNWRITQAPGQPYTTVAVAQGDRISAFVTYRTAHKHGGLLGYVMEAMHATGEEQTLVELLRWVKAELRKQAVDAVLAQCLSHSANFQAFGQAGFWTVPLRIMPQDIYFGAFALSPEGAVATSRESWYLSYLDSDSA